MVPWVVSQKSESALQGRAALEVVHTCVAMIASIFADVGFVRWQVTFSF